MLGKINIDLAILTETRIVNEKYAREAAGYTITSTVAKSKHQGGVALIHRKESDRFTVEGTLAFGPNVIRATVKSGRKAWTIIGAYIPPSETGGFTLAAINAARDSAPARRPVIMMGDLNVDLKNIRTGDGEARRLETAALVDSLGLVDIQRHFRIRKRNEGSWTWNM